MAASADSRAGDPGLGQLGTRLILGALVVIAILLLLQRQGEGDREDAAAFALVSGTMRIPGLGAPVEILRDERGIPHVLASGERDGWFGLGFAHAQDRLAQMVWLRRRAQGRTAEIVGESGLAADRLARLLQIESVSEVAAKDLPSASSEVLEAYAAGVNARIERLGRGLPAPPRMLREPLESIEPWRPADSLAVVKLLSWCMGGTLETTLVLDALIQRLDSVPARPFFPGGASMDFGMGRPFEVERPRSLGDDDADRPTLAAGEPTRALCQGIGQPTGSAFVVGSERSRSGSPLLVADWHLEPAVPALFHEARIAAKPVEVAGATLPGSPIFWAGRSRSLGWAAVPAGAPVADLFIETLRETRGQYQNGTRWVPLQESTETLRVRDARGRIEEHELVLRATRHGPLIDALELPGVVDPGEDPRPIRSALALAWTGARRGDGLTSMLGLLRATDASSVEAALREHHEPVLAVVYASGSGEAGMQVAGWLPKRFLPTGLVPVQGQLRAFDWRARVPLDELPGQRLATEAASWLVAVDQPWKSRGGLDQLEWLWRPGRRAARLEARLAQLVAERPEGIDLRTAASLLEDDVSHRAPAVVTAIRALARRSGSLPAEAEEILRLLARWDGRMAANSAAAAAYQLVLEHALEELLQQPFGEALLDRYVRAPHVQPQYAVERLLVRAAQLRRAGGWTDEQRAMDAVRTSLRRAWLSLNHRLGPTRERWQWGELHRLRFVALGPPRTLPGGLARAIPIGGDEQTLAMARHRMGVSFDVERASLFRIAMDLSASDRLLSALAPGQTEHPGHSHFSDGMARLVGRNLSLFPTSRLVIEEESAERLLLEPPR